MQSYFVMHITKDHKCKLYRQKTAVLPVDGGQFPTECLYMSSRWNGIPRQVSLIILQVSFQIKTAEDEILCTGMFSFHW